MLDLYVEDAKKALDLAVAYQDVIEEVAELCWKRIVQGHKILICGNGGSAADAQHFAAEIVGRFQAERPGMPCIALTTDTSILTAIGNDYGYHEIFARQVRALGNKGDIVIGISTSGNSPNVLNALQDANANQMITVSFTGKTGGLIHREATHKINIPVEVTSHVQEAHEVLLHYLALRIEQKCRQAMDAVHVGDIS